WHRLAPDIEIAAHSSMPVLISGRPDATLTIARAITRAANLDPVADVRILDPIGGEDLLMTVTARTLQPGRPFVLLLREVQRYSAAQQADIVQLLAFRRERYESRPRIVPSPSASLLH